MREYNVIQQTGQHPATVDSLATDLEALGLRPGMAVLVHSSLSALGWVCGGPVAVILALEHAISRTGTLVMPTHSGNLSDPAHWENPPVPQPWWQIIRDTMPAYDPDLTPSWGVGIIPECFRKQTGVRRSAHPQYSFAAWGARAETVIDQHSLDFGLGERSPLARLYDLNGWVLLLGVGHGSNTSLHLAEYRANYPAKRWITSAAPVLVNGRRHWYEYQDIIFDTEDFTEIGQAYAAQGGTLRQGYVARAPAQLIPQRALVDFAVTWLERNRK